MNEPDFTIGCPNCGCTSIHACPGKPVTWSDEEREKLNQVFADLFWSQVSLEREFEDVLFENLGELNDDKR